MIQIFIYDDNKARCESLLALVELTENMNCVGHASNCVNVVADMEHANPDVVLMDIEMPEVDGIIGVKKIKQQYPTIKVIMQTVYEDADKIFACLKNGADGYILKKASIHTIIESIIEVHNGGAFMTPSVALKVMNYFKEPEIKDNKLETLSPREIEVLHKLAEGLSYKMIGSELGISYGTVNNHIKKIYEKLQVHSLGEAVAYAIHNNLKK